MEENDKLTGTLTAVAEHRELTTRLREMLYEVRILNHQLNEARLHVQNEVQDAAMAVSESRDSFSDIQISQLIGIAECFAAKHALVVLRHQIAKDHLARRPPQ